MPDHHPATRFVIRLRGRSTGGQREEDIDEELVQDKRHPSRAGERGRTGQGSPDDPFSLVGARDAAPCRSLLRLRVLRGRIRRDRFHLGSWRRGGRRPRRLAARTPGLVPGRGRGGRDRRRRRWRGRSIPASSPRQESDARGADAGLPSRHGTVRGQNPGDGGGGGAS